MQTTETENSAVSLKTQQETRWVKMAQNGDRQAFEQLAGLYYGDIFRMIYYRTQRHMDAEDLTQEVFFKAYKRLGSLADETRFKGWLYRIAVNRVRDFQRRKKLLHLFKSTPGKDMDSHVDTRSAAASDPLDVLMRKRFFKESEMFLSRLSRMEKDVFVLRFMDQLQINEIATALKKGESTIKTHLYRALSKFKKDRAFQSFLKGE
jgi:RNA polymerase sigma-70 factor (ECF subfamily)